MRGNQMHTQLHQMPAVLQQPYAARILSPVYRAATRTSGAPPLSAQPSKQQLPVYIDDAATQSFLNWARSAAGIQCGKVRPAAFSGIRGLAASQDIAADDVIVSVPRQAALTLPPKQRCPCPGFVNPSYWDSSPWFVKLAIRLLDEQSKGTQSHYHIWLQQLPRAVDSPVSWSQELVQQLQYAHLIHKVTEQQQEWSALYDSFLQQGVVNKAAAASKQEFFRALLLVRSRTFSGPYVASTLSDRLRLAGFVAALVATNTLLGGDLTNSLAAAAAVFLFNVVYEVVLSSKLKQYAMCPVIDLANHSSKNTTEVSYDYLRDAFLVAAGATYAPEEQVFISYGAQNNDSLMQMYGFAEPDNPYDVYVMTSLLKWLEELQPPSQARLDQLNKEGLLQALQEVVITRQGFGAQTLQALRYLLVPAPSSSSNSDVQASNNPAAAAAASSGSGSGSAAAADSQGLSAGSPSSYQAAADKNSERKIALVLVHACQRELAVLGAAPESRQTSSSNSKGSRKGNGRFTSNTNGSGSSFVDAAAAQAAAAAFRLEKRKVLLACLSQLTDCSGSCQSDLVAQPAASATAGQ